MKTKADEVTIKVPPGLPDGWECYKYGKPKDGEMVHQGSEWVLAHKFSNRCDCLCARPRQSPATWANAQPLLGAVAKVCRGDVAIYTDVFDVMNATALQKARAFLAAFEPKEEKTT